MSLNRTLAGIDGVPDTIRTVLGPVYGTRGLVPTDDSTDHYGTVGGRNYKPVMVEGDPVIHDAEGAELDSDQAAVVLAGLGSAALIEPTL